MSKKQILFYSRFKWLIIISFCFLLVFSGSFIFLLEFRKVSSGKITVWDESYKADCAVVLTGGTGRVQEGFALLSRRSIRKLIISGVHSKATLRDIFPLWPFYGELNQEDVILEKKSKTTYGNAQETRRLVFELGCKNLILITSYTHIYRAGKVFKSFFPYDYEIYLAGVAPQLSYISFESYVIETLKSLFYSLWAY